MASPKEKQDAMSGADNVVELRDNKPLFNDDELSQIHSVDDALAAFDESLEDISDYGSGFSLCDDKGKLVKVPFVIVQWRFNDDASKAQYGPYVSAAVVTKNGDKLIVNDGSTGICAQLRAVTDKRLRDGVANTQAGLTCKYGLRVSTYPATTPDGMPILDKETGEQIVGTTYYLA